MAELDRGTRVKLVANKESTYPSFAGKLGTVVGPYEVPYLGPEHGATYIEVQFDGRKDTYLFYIGELEVVREVAS